MVILAFDQSVTATAAAVLDGYPGMQALTLRETYTHKSKGKGIHRMVRFKEYLESLVTKIGAHVLVREMHNQRTFGAASQLHGLATLMDYEAYRSGYLENGRYVIVPNTSWKKFCLGKGNFKKDTAYLMHMNKFFNSTPWLDGTNHEVMDDNTADAICLGIYAHVARMVEVEEQIVPGLLKYQTESLAKAAVMFEYGCS